MRALADAERVGRFMRALARHAREPGSVYVTGGATAVLERGHEQDVADVRAMLDRKLIEPESM